MNKPSSEQMAKLPKWAQAHIADIELDRRMALAFRVTPPVDPDVLPPEPGDCGPNLKRGFVFNAHSVRVEEACSSYLYHAVGKSDGTNAQGSIRMYSTRKLALRGMRNAVESECMAKLAIIDKKIEDEE